MAGGSLVLVLHFTAACLAALVSPPSGVGATEEVVYCYDGRKPVRLTGPVRVECGGGIVASERGLLTGVGNLASRTEYEHDIAGRTTRVIQITEGSPATAGSRAVSYQYWASDRISETTLPSSRRVVECIDARLRVSWASATKTLNDCSGNAAVSASEAYLSAAEYAAHGVPLRWQLGNGLYEVSQYNAFLQLERKRIGANSSLTQGCGSAPDDQLCLEWSYGASTNNGNVTSSRQWARKTAGGYLNLQASFGYDGRNRLTTFNESVVSGGSSGGSWGQTNSYDRYGNRWANPSGITQSDWTPTQQSNVDAAKNQITTAKAGASTAPVTHDAAGYMTAHPQIVGSLSYDAEGRLVSGGGGTYTYDGEVRRVKRVTGGGSYWYWYGADGGLIGEDTPEAVEAGVQYLSTDALGSTRLVTKGNQEVAARIDYWPFGEEIVASSAAGNRDLVSGYGGAAALKQRFTGKERDPEIGLDYFGARYLASAQGRWTSPDAPFADQHVEDPQSWNLYGYVRNNPLKLVDQDGQSAILVGAVGGGFIGGAVAAWRGESIWKGAASGAIAGAVAGSVIDTGGASLGVLALSGAAGGVTGGIVSRGLSGEGTSLQQAAVDAAVGGTVGLVLGAGGKAVSAALSKSTPAVAEGASAVSPRVQGIAKQIEEGGFKVTANPKTANQTGNVTITQPGSNKQLNLRVETGPTPQGNRPHANVQVMRPNQRIPTKLKEESNVHIYE